MTGIDIDAVHAGQAATVHRRRASDAVQDEAVRELSPLTQRQRDILGHYAKGFTVLQSSKLLGIKDKDVSNERTRIMTALNCTMIEAAMTAKTAGWV